MMIDFIFRDACVYENSRQVMETRTSAVVMMAYASTCQLIDGVCPIDEFWATAMIMNPRP